VVDKTPASSIWTPPIKPIRAQHIEIEDAFQVRSTDVMPA